MANERAFGKAVIMCFLCGPSVPFVFSEALKQPFLK